MTLFEKFRESLHRYIAVNYSIHQIHQLLSGTPDLIRLKTWFTSS